jgi:putative membrane protein
MNAASYPLIVVVGIFLAGSVSCGKSHVHAAAEGADRPGPTAREIMSIDEKNFLIAAERAEVRERALARIALDKSANIAVREFARQVIEDRDRDIGRLALVMNQQNVTQGSTIAEGVELEVSQRLHRLAGATFDHEFVSLMTADQQQAVGIFRRAAETSPDYEIRKFAADALPSIRRDFERAAKLEQTFRR